MMKMNLIQGYDIPKLNQELKPYISEHTNIVVKIDACMYERTPASVRAVNGFWMVQDSFRPVRSLHTSFSSDLYQTFDGISMYDVLFQGEKIYLKPFQESENITLFFVLLVKWNKERDELQIHLSTFNDHIYINAPHYKQLRIDAYRHASSQNKKEQMDNDYQKLPSLVKWWGGEKLKKRYNVSK